MAALTFLAEVVGSIQRLGDVLQPLLRAEKVLSPSLRKGKQDDRVKAVHSFKAVQLSCFSEYLFDICYVKGRLKILQLHTS